MAKKFKSTKALFDMIVSSLGAQETEIPDSQRSSSRLATDSSCMSRRFAQISEASC
jgi:hypothetical protein